MNFSLTLRILCLGKHAGLVDLVQGQGHQLWEMVEHQQRRAEVVLLLQPRLEVGEVVALVVELDAFGVVGGGPLPLPRQHCPLVVGAPHWLHRHRVVRIRVPLLPRQGRGVRVPRGVVLPDLLWQVGLG
jgi:hypothetical protein